LPRDDESAPADIAKERIMANGMKARIDARQGVALISALILASWMTDAVGGASVQATLANGKAFDTLEATGDFWVRAYSEQGGRKNVTVTPTVVANGATINPLPGPRPFPPTPGYYVSRNGAAIDVPTGRMAPPNNLNGKVNPIIDSLRPTASLVNNIGQGAFDKASWLVLDGDQVTVTSTTGQYRGQASAFIASGRRITANASVADPLPPPPGAAAARAVDPFYIPSVSVLAYDPTIDASLQLDTAGVSGGSLYWATDSSVFTAGSVDNFDEAGTQLDQTLWYLSLGGVGPLTNPSGIGVDFVLNPLALREISFSSSFLAGLGTYTDAASEARLINLAVDRLIASALTFNGSAFVLPTGFHLFPTGTMFMAASGGVQYADGVDAGLVDEPENVSLVLLGLIGAGTFGRRKVTKA
jgi:hypothetical protein